MALLMVTVVGRETLVGLDCVRIAAFDVKGFGACTFNAFA